MGANKYLLFFLLELVEVEVLLLLTVKSLLIINFLYKLTDSILSVALQGRQYGDHHFMNVKIVAQG